MQFHPADLALYAAAAASLYAAWSKTMSPLRSGLTAAFLLVAIYGAIERQAALASLALILAVLNAWRLFGMKKLVRDINAAAKGDMNVDWLMPYTRPKSFKSGQIITRRGDYATAAYYIVSGDVEVVEIGRSFGKGVLLGEIGLFAPDGRRLMTVRCASDVETAVIDYDQFKELYFANPQFGFRLLHLIVARLVADREPAAPSAVM
ncbi:MAG TPA: cyclic nucleotide-binding domain-containing protein [Beijerinckiaceae bacterium]|nr:cyclic nucleotide-binding domain-containing protein [Beijerinckiaceae bacterium]